MGDLCSKQAPMDPLTSIQEFYDPFSEWKQQINNHPDVMRLHAPAGGLPLDKLPTSILKKEAEYKEKFP